MSKNVDLILARSMDMKYVFLNAVLPDGNLDSVANDHI